MKIKNINIHAFRGIPDLELDLQEKNLLLQGENGTGKSSIVDAIEFFFTSKVSHLVGKQAISLKKHATNVNFNPDDLKVELEINPGNCVLSRTLEREPECPDEIQAEFNVAENGKFILRRSQILKFIESTPAKRYEFIGDVLGAANLDQIELEMKRAQDYFKDQIKIHQNTIEENYSFLGQLLGENIKELEELIPFIQEKLNFIDLKPINSLDELEEYVKNLTYLGDKENLEKIQALERFLNLNESINSFKLGINEEFHQAEELKNEIVKSHRMSDISIIKILENARNILRSDSVDTCPLCEQQIDENQLLDRIEERLDDLYGLSDAKDNLKKSIERIKDLIKSLKIELEKLLPDISLFEELKVINEGLKSKIESITAFYQDLSYQIFLEGRFDKKELDESINELNTISNNLMNASSELKDSLKTSNKDEALVVLIDDLDTIDQMVKKIISTLKVLEKKEKEHEWAKKIYNYFSTVKKTKIQGIYDSIEQDIVSFYDFLHPHESHMNIKLGIDSKKRASTNLKMDIFGRENEDPRALNSEGHLDSLGLCIFLALVKKFNEDFSIVVLDDVVTTVDSRHRENVCKLLFEEFGDKQLIITTHDAIWFDQLKAAQRAYNQVNNFQNMNIIGWDLESGPVIRPYIDRWDKIQEKIKEGDRNCAANEGRRYLEWLLDDICKRISAPIPLNPSGRFSVKELFDPAYKKLKDNIKEPEFKEKVVEAFQNLEKTMIMGNLLSHNNIIAGNVSIKEVETFCLSVKTLDLLMQCPKCENTIRYYRNLKILRCSKTNCEDPFEIRFGK